MSAVRYLAALAASATATPTRAGSGTNGMAGPGGAAVSLRPPRRLFAGEQMLAGEPAPHESSGWLSGYEHGDTGGKARSDELRDAAAGRVVGWGGLYDGPAGSWAGAEWAARASGLGVPRGAGFGRVAARSAASAAGATGWRGLQGIGELGAAGGVESALGAGGELGAGGGVGSAAGGGAGDGWDAGAGGEAGAGAGAGGDLGAGAGAGGDLGAGGGVGSAAGTGAVAGGQGADAGLLAPRGNVERVLRPDRGAPQQRAGRLEPSAPGAAAQHGHAAALGVTPGHSADGQPRPAIEALSAASADAVEPAVRSAGTGFGSEPAAVGRTIARASAPAREGQAAARDLAPRALSPLVRRAAAIEADGSARRTAPARGSSLRIGSIEVTVVAAPAAAQPPTRRRAAPARLMGTTAPSFGLGQR